MTHEPIASLLAKYADAQGRFSWFSLSCEALVRD